MLRAKYCQDQYRGRCVAELLNVAPFRTLRFLPVRDCPGLRLDLADSGPFDDPRARELDREAQPFIAAKPELRRGSNVLKKFSLGGTHKTRLAERISSQYPACERLQLAISASISDKSVSTSRCVHLGALVDSTTACPARMLKLT